ncbi:MAG: hypothetical protein NWF13_03040 [Candidatus Bathyarchaeota archaeon]|nr:hypothetical protein [Candidatus Bathyarchaeota archaeon]
MGVTDVNWKVNAGLMVVMAHGVFGIINLIVFVLSGASMLHMGILGAISLAISVGLFTRRPGFLWLAIALAPLTLAIGVSSLYASIGFFGLNPNQLGLLFNLGLIAYSTAALLLFFYLISKRKTLFH